MRFVEEERYFIKPRKTRKGFRDYEFNTTFNFLPKGNVPIWNMLEGTQKHPSKLKGMLPVVVNSYIEGDFLGKTRQIDMIEGWDVLFSIRRKDIKSDWLFNGNLPLYELSIAHKVSLLFGILLNFMWEQYLFLQYLVWLQVFSILKYNLDDLTVVVADLFSIKGITVELNFWFLASVGFLLIDVIIGRAFGKSSSAHWVVLNHFYQSFDKSGLVQPNVQYYFYHSVGLLIMIK